MTKTNELVCLNKVSHYLDTVLFRGLRQKKCRRGFGDSTLSPGAGVQMVTDQRS